MVRASAAQIPVNRPLEQNLVNIILHIEKAKAAGSSIVTFPELILSSSSWPDYKDREYAINKIGETCASLKIWAVVGGYVQRKDKVFNETYVLDQAGKLRHTYQKVNLWQDETGVTPGKSNSVIDTKEFGKIAVISCYDITFPKYVKSLAREGAKIILCPAYWPYSIAKNGIDYRGYPQLCARENNAYVVFCDAYENETIGKSRIVSPQGVRALATNKEMLITADLRLGELNTQNLNRPRA